MGKSLWDDLCAYDRADVGVHWAMLQTFGFHFARCLRCNPALRPPQFLERTHAQSPSIIPLSQ